MKINNGGSVMQVTDYSRDLDEMQNVSREEYLASLRRWKPSASIPSFILLSVHSEQETLSWLSSMVYAERVVASQEA